MEEALANPQENGTECADEQSPKAAPGRGTPPEHAEQEGCQQWRIENGEQRLYIVHNTVEVRGDVGRTDAEDDADDGDDSPHPEIVTIWCVAFDVRAVDVVGPDCVEGGHIACHTAHE